MADNSTGRPVIEDMHYAGWDAVSAAELELIRTIRCQ
jgi:hypothetical protein